MSNGDVIRAQFDDGLYHYGVPGMKWGHRKSYTIPQVSQKSTNRIVNKAEQAKRQMQQARQQYKKSNKQFDKAYRNANSWIANLQFDKADRKRRENELVEASVKSEKASKAYKKAKANYKLSKKQAKTAVKDIKKQYRKQYMAGENAVGKIYAKLTDADKYYADIQYNLNRSK